MAGLPDAAWTDIDLDRPGAADELRRLAAELKVAPQVVADALDGVQRPRVTRHHGHLFVHVHVLSLAQEAGEDHDSRLRTAPVSALVLPDHLVTVHRASQFPMDRVVEHWQEDIEAGSRDVAALLHGLLDEVVDGHADLLQDLEDQAEALEDDLFGDRGRAGGMQQVTYRLRKEVVQTRRAVLPMRDVVAALLRSEDDGFVVPRSLQGRYQDLADLAQHDAERTGGLREIVNSIFETNLSLQDARRNIVMKKLAGWAAVIAVPTAVTGWFGQNIPFPGFSSPWGLAASTTLVVLGTLALYLVLRRRDWI
ncbi:magnesium transporter CorA family protein [Luteococcus sediminum]